MAMVSDIIKYEQGELGTFEVVELFSTMIKSGMVWKLQGSYGRSAVRLIEAGYLTEQGEITDLAREELEDDN